MQKATKRKLFFSLWPDENTRQQLAAIAKAYPAAGVKMPPANLHLTLVFIGYVDQQMQSCLEGVADEIRMPAFDITIDCIDQFGQKIHWSGSSHPPAELFGLQRTLTQACQDRCGYQPETRPYRPHVTLERKPKRKLSGSIDTPVVWHADSFSLIESLASDITGQPPTYRPLRRWPLIEPSSSKRLGKRSL